jgi:hypothetical protein
MIFSASLARNARNCSCPRYCSIDTRIGTRVDAEAAPPIASVCRKEIRMISFAGIILMVLGVASGLILLLAPFDIGPAIPGITTWILFPGFTLVGYVLFAVEARTTWVVGASRVAGAALLALALVAAIALFAVGNGLIAAAVATQSLWYVLALGAVMGATGLALGRAGKFMA